MAKNASKLKVIIDALSAILDIWDCAEALDGNFNGLRAAKIAAYRSKDILLDTFNTLCSEAVDLMDSMRRIGIDKNEAIPFGGENKK